MADGHRQPEIEIAWINQDGKPWMFGGIVYHAHSGEWGGTHITISPAHSNVLPGNHLNRARKMRRAKLKGGPMELEQISISQKAYDRWRERCAAEIANFPPGLSPADIPDEQAVRQTDGSLLLFVEIPGHKRISITISPEEWTWNH